MHELSLAAELVSTCRQVAGTRTVVEVQIRCPAGVDVAELREGFTFLTGPAGPDSACLGNAALKVEEVPARLRCSCGFDGEVPDGAVAGRIGVCPRCARAGELQHGLELVSLGFA